MPNFSHPYASFLHHVEKPARYVGGEYNQIVKDDADVKVRLALAFPDVYDIGMSHLGTKILYSLINKRDGMQAERVFCPWVDMEKELRERKLPLLSLETARSLTDFDVIGFSLQYELTYTNILTMLDLSGIPFRWADRDESHPLIIAGGPTATQPEPMAPFIDVFLIGDAEEKLPELLEVYRAQKDAGATRTEALVALAKLGGLYCPALYGSRKDDRTGFVLVDKPLHEGVPEKTKRVILEDINRFPFPDDSPVAAAEAIFDRMSVEIARGCTEGCRFCQAGMIYRPVRERDPEDIVNTLVSAIEKGGYDEASMTTLSTADYSCISPLIKRVMEKLRPEKVSLSVASLRAYGLDEDTLDEIKSVRANGLTFAPEAGTQRMRDVINKNISNEDLDTTAHRVFSRGWRRMKLYFMIGLPTETEEDVAGIMETGRRMKNIGRNYHKGNAGVTVSVSSHVPKPHTPFQWVAMDAVDIIEKKQDYLKDLSRRYRLEFRRHDPRTSYLECILGRGDRRMADLIEGAWHRGARFDSWDEHLRWEEWVSVLEENKDIPYDAFTGTIPVDADLPWDHLDIQVEKKFLLRDYRRSLKDKLSPPCGKPVGAQVHHTNLEEHEADERILVCYHCGVTCDMTDMRDERGEFLTKLKALKPKGSLDDAEAADVGEADAGDLEVVSDSSPLVEVTTEMATAPTELAKSIAKGEVSQPQSNPYDKNKNQPPKFDQGEKFRYRLRFSKHGVAALTGHLDFVRTLPRVMRRAGFKAYYSEGFHPKPIMEFSPPLPLGVHSQEEFVDVSLCQDVLAESMVEKLRAVAPNGLDFTGAMKLGEQDRKLSRALEAAEYLICLPHSLLQDVGVSADELEALSRKLLSRGNILRDVIRKRKPKTVDLRPAIDALWVLDEGPANFWEDTPASFIGVRLLVKEHHARPEEVAAELLGGTAALEPIHLLRTALLRRSEDGTAWASMISEPLVTA